MPSGSDGVVIVSAVPPDEPPDELNVAVTVVLEFNVRAQVPVPAQPPPLQPANVDPVDGVAVNVTFVPEENDLEQVDPQSIPDGLLVTLPLPVPDFVTRSVTPLPLPPLPLPLSNTGAPLNGAVVGASL